MDITSNGPGPQDLLPAVIARHTNLKDFIVIPNQQLYM